MTADLKEVEMAFFSRIWELEGILIGQQRLLINHMEKFVPQQAHTEWNKMMTGINNTLAELKGLSETVKQMRAERGEKTGSGLTRFDLDIKLPKN